MSQFFWELVLLQLIMQLKFKPIADNFFSMQTSILIMWHKRIWQNSKI